MAQAEDSRQADQLCYNPGPPQHIPYLRTAKACEGAAEPKLEDLHDTGQQQVIWEEALCGSDIDSMAKGRDLELDQQLTSYNEHL